MYLSSNQFTKLFMGFGNIEYFQMQLEWKECI